MEKTILLCAFLALLYTPLPASASQDNQAASRTGFSANLFLGGGWVTGKSSGLEAESGKTRLAGWDQAQKTIASMVPMGEAFLRYTFATGTTLSAGSGATSGGSPTLGISQEISGLGTLGILGSMGSSDVWKNPYLLDTNRLKTPQRKKTLGLFFENILETGLDLHYKSTWTHVKDDLIGREKQDLLRKGNTHDLQLGFGLPLGEQHVLSPGLRYERGNFAGKSNSYEAFGADLALTRMMEGWMLTLSLGGLVKNFEKTHPVFANVRKEKEGSATLTLTVPEPMGYKKITLMVILAHNSVQANHAFFDSRSTFAGTGLGYAF